MQLEWIEPRFSGRRVVVAATGPSLTPEIAELCRDEIVIAVNDAWRLLPWAALLYACDGRWWGYHNGCPDFAGERWTSHSLHPPNDKSQIAGRFGLHVIAGVHKSGFSRAPALLHYGRNSGFQAVNLALLAGADPIVLVGFDMRAVDGKRHFFGEHPKAVRRNNIPFAEFVGAFERAARDLPAGVHILNATPGSALGCFPVVPLGKFLRHERMREAA